MTSLRPFRPQDLLHMNITNLDPLTENYNIDFYLQYLSKWPSLFTVVEDQYGNITGYSKPPIFHPAEWPELIICVVMGKVEEDPPWRQFTEHYLLWHGHVTALTVAPQYRRLGLAQTLTKALERGCEEENAWFVDLFVREGNKTAVGLYEGIGYASTLSRDEPQFDVPLMRYWKQIQRLSKSSRLLQRRSHRSESRRRCV